MLKARAPNPGGLKGGNADALLATVSTLCRPSNAPAIQQSVKCIIRCASAIAPAHRLSPAIVSTTPLFTAGCEARVEDRDLIRNLLVRLLEVLRIRNIKLAIDILESHWADGHNGEWQCILRMCFIFWYDLNGSNIYQDERTGISSHTERCI